jgi:hypothetical protein
VGCVFCVCYSRFQHLDFHFFMIINNDLLSTINCYLTLFLLTNQTDLLLFFVVVFFISIFMLCNKITNLTFRLKKKKRKKRSYVATWYYKCCILPQYPTKPLEVLEVGPGGSLGFFFKLQLKKNEIIFRITLKIRRVMMKTMTRMKTRYYGKKVCKDE